MKIVYAKTMLQHIREAGYQAKVDGKEIEKIVLTVKEARQLLHETGTVLYVPNTCLTWYTDLTVWLFKFENSYACAGPQPEFRVMGVRIEVER